MSVIVNKYPLDLTGKRPDNYIPGERHDLDAAVTTGNYRVFVPNYGGFYTQDMVVRDVSGTPLRKGEDYIATYLYERPTLRSGLEVCGAVVIVNPNVSTTVFMDYQVVGGDFAVSTDALQQVLNTLAEEDRPVEWANIIGKPNEYPAAGHLHALWELYGFEPVVTELERITQAIMAGDQALHDETRAYALTLFEEAGEARDALERRLVDHMEDGTNPHDVTKAQVGLGDVENYKMATDVQAAAMDVKTRYMSPHAVGVALATHANPNVNHHDGRYVRISTTEETSLRVNNNRLQAYVNGGWKTIWPAQWV
jgi:hypothetical protein